MFATAVPYAVGALGAVPFVALTPQLSPHLPFLHQLLSTPNSRARAQITYGATILSFLGGIHWGYLLNSPHSAPHPTAPAQQAAAENATKTAARTATRTAAKTTATRFIWSVTPSLVAWQACLFNEATLACGTLIGGLGAAAAVDTMYAKMGAYPRWMMPMRYALTATACASLGATAFHGREQWSPE